MAGCFIDCWGFLCLCQYVHRDHLQGHSLADCGSIKCKWRPNHSHRLTGFFRPLGLHTVAFDSEKVLLIKLDCREICQWLLDCEQVSLFLTKLAVCLNIKQSLLILIQGVFCRARIPCFFFFGSLLTTLNLAHSHWRLSIMTTVSHWPLSKSTRAPGGQVLCFRAS